MGSRRCYAKLALVLLVFILSFFCGAEAYAAVTDFVAVDGDDKYYEYNYESLLTSYVLYLLTGEGQIYSHYTENQVTALLDSTNGYVDYADVLEAYAVAVITKQPFDLNTYTSSDKAKAAEMPEKVLLVTLREDNILQFTEKYLDPTSAALRLFNEASNKGKIRELLSSHADSVGIDLVDFSQLTDFGKNTVAEKILQARPEGGFSELEEIKAIFDLEVSMAKALLEGAIAAINDAPDKEAMMEALLGEVELFGICTLLYAELSSERKGEVAEELFGLKPFSSATQVKNAFRSAVSSAMSYFTVYYTDYGLTLTEMVDIQMAKSPQTDLYGGGWKDARREDVEFYVDPDNFVDPYIGEDPREMVRITASVLNVRENPTTQSDVLTKVYSGQMYLIEDAREGEPGTAPGTEGLWYKITANNLTGWVSSAYVEVTQASISSSMFQFLVLSGSAGVTEEDLGKILEGRGILSGKESSFMEGSLLHNVNEVFLVALSLHETGNGRSTLANGIEYPDEDNLFPDQDYVMVYNMFGIGAYDNSPNYYGARYAYRAGWFTPELAIVGGAQFTSNSYINHSTYRQNTLYKMRWNPGDPGRHQYATDIGWASKQVGRIKSLYDQCIDYNLEFDIPRYKN